MKIIEITESNKKKLREKIVTVSGRLQLDVNPFRLLPNYR